jgi:hypothetical protein
MVMRLRQVADDPRCADVTVIATEYLRSLFATPRSPGIALAIEALGHVAHPDDVAATMTDYTRRLLDAFDS